MKQRYYEIYRKYTANMDLPIVFLIVLATYLIYAQTAHFGIVLYDDDVFLSKNPHILNGFTMRNLVWSASTYVNANYAPLTLWSYMLDGFVFKTWYPGFHITNFILHMLNGILLYFITRKLTKSVFVGFFTGMLFIVHPLHVESVAWISQRKDVLSAVFMLLSMSFYLRYKSYPNSRAQLISVLLFLCGMLSKVIIAPLPLALLLIDFVYDEIRDRRELLRSIASKWMYFIVAVVIGLANVYTQEASGALKNLASFPLSIRLENALLNYMAYPLKMLWPVDLIPINLFRHQIPVWEWLLSGISMAAITYLTFRLRNKHKYVFFGWFWYLLFITPVVGIIQTGVHSYADRYSYLSLIGPMMVVAYAFKLATKRYSLWRRICIPVSFLIVFVLIVMSNVQTRYWENTFTLFSHTLKVDKKNYVAMNQLAHAYEVNKDYKNAEKYYLRELENSPDNVLSVGFVAKFYAYSVKNPDKALALLEARLDKPDVEHQEILLDIANVYLNYHSYNKAIKYAAQALQYNHKLSNAYLIMAFSYLGKNEIQNAIVNLQDAIKYDSLNVQAYKELIKIYLRAGMYEDARLLNEQVMQINPSRGYTEKSLAQVIKNLKEQEPSNQ